MRKKNRDWLRRFFRRMNRGVLAGCVLLLALAGYITADSLAFQREKADIEHTVREYVERSPQLAILPSSFAGLGVNSRDGMVEQKMEQNEELLRRYWSFRTDDRGYNQGETLLNHVHEVVSYNAENNGTIESAKGIVQYVNSIVKTGPDEAEIFFTYTGSVKYSGSVKWVVFNTSPPEGNDEFSLYLSIGDVGSSTGSESISPSGDIRAVMVKQDGRWLIDRVTYASVYTGSTN